LQAAEKVRAAVAAEPLLTTAGSIAITASFGVATLTHNGDGDGTPQRIDQLIAAADTRLYASKHAGRNRVTGE
jgi:PleD family two-component response regulator